MGTLEQAARRVAQLVLFGSFFLGAGCGHFHSVAPVEADLAQVCHEVPEAGRCHVYLFFVQGSDYFDCANLHGLKKYVQELGFIKAWYGHSHHTDYFEELIVHYAEADPNAKFVLVGYGTGARKIRQMACNVSQADVPVDMMVYLSPKFYEAAPSCPGNVRQLLHIVPKEKFKENKSLPCAATFIIADADDNDIPGHCQTTLLLIKKLSVIAGSIPVRGTPVILTPAEEKLEVLPEPQKLGEWDFLKPVPPQ